MAQTAALAKLVKVVKKLRKQRQFHLAALGKIDAMFAALGIGNGGIPTPFSGGKAGPAKRWGRKRRKFDQTATEFVLGVVAGKKLTTGEINAVWKQAGRGSTANVTLMNLVKAKKLKRTPIKDGRGSIYRLA